MNTLENTKEINLIETQEFQLARKRLEDKFSDKKEADLLRRALSDLKEGAVLTEAAPQALSPREIAQMIDHTFLKPETTAAQIRKLCQEALTYHFHTVCIPPLFVPLARESLKGSPVKTITVIGFPLGYQSTETKIFETKQAIEDGAEEIDMVISIAALKSGAEEMVFDEIAEIVKTASPLPVKVILETSLLNTEEKIIACLLSKMAGAAFVKTSTGFSKGGATENDVKLMRAIVGTEMGVKASGGIRTYEDAVKMIRAGANRLGASAGVSIVTGTNPETTGNHGNPGTSGASGGTPEAAEQY